MTEALFINGVFEEVLEEILQVQSALPEQILYLQPHAGRCMVELRRNPPSVEQPMKLFTSTTADLSHIRYAGEVVGWWDKRSLGEERRHVLNRLIWTLQPKEGGLYTRAKSDGPVCINLLAVWRMKQLAKPLPVSLLTTTRKQVQLSMNRTTAGGWAYVQEPSIAA